MLLLIQLSDDALVWSGFSSLKSRAASACLWACRPPGPLRACRPPGPLRAYTALSFCSAAPPSLDFLFASLRLRASFAATGAASPSPSLRAVAPPPLASLFADLRLRAPARADEGGLRRRSLRAMGPPPLRAMAPPSLLATVGKLRKAV